MPKDIDTEPEIDNLKKSLDNIFNPQPTSVRYQPNPVSTEREEEFGSSYTPSKKKL